MPRSSWAVMWLMGMVVAGCMPRAQRMTGESLVLAGTTPGRLIGEKIDAKSVVVRSTYLPGGTVYEPGRDYRFDGQSRSIARVEGSRIPDFSANVLFGKKDFDHAQFAGYGNGKFFVFVDYEFRGPLFRGPLKLATPTKISGLLLERVMHFANDPAILEGWQGSLTPVT
jgi:hypothetical protein